MADLLFECFSEEMPARMQAPAAEQLRTKLTDALKAARLSYGEVRCFVSPRHLGILVRDLPAHQPDQRVEKKGPKTSAPDQAIEGFCRSVGMAREALEVRHLGKEEVYFAVKEEKGQPTAEALKPMLEEILRGFHWPKSMRWGDHAIQWVRPLQALLCLLDDQVVPVEFGHLKASNVTYGHRFLAPEAIEIAHPGEYIGKLEQACVQVEREVRRERIETELAEMAAEKGLRVVEDDALLDEVTGLVEWPTVLLGTFEEKYLSLPPEVLLSEMREHQKYFGVEVIPDSLSLPKGSDQTGRPLSRALGSADEGAQERDPALSSSHREGQEAGAGDKHNISSGARSATASLRAAEASPRIARSTDLAESQSLTNHFLVVANLPTADGGAAIVHGNGRVLRARLADGQFYWDADRHTPLSEWAKKLEGLIFHAKIGSVKDKADRLERLAPLLAVFVPHAHLTHCARAAQLAKADLVTGMVGEFPELQGIMGRYYAYAQGEEAEVAEAIAAHYKPLGASDDVPTAPASMVVALADKLDTLVGLFAIGEKPTGSKDPFALRRAALGVLRIILAGGLRVKLSLAFEKAASLYPKKLFAESPKATVAELLAFFEERLKVMLKAEGVRHDVISAVMADGAEDDVVLVAHKARALQALLEGEDGVNLLAAYKRAANIVQAEEKKDATRYDDAPDESLFEVEEERALNTALTSLHKPMQQALKNEQFEEAMTALASLRAPLDAYFDAVMVNAEDPAVRTNRLNTLASLRKAIETVADFSRIEG